MRLSQFFARRERAAFVVSVAAVVGSVVAAPPIASPVTAATVPATFVAQGPRPITGGQVENVTPNDEVAGAVHTIVAHPTDANRAWIGTVNGGVWRTTDATAASPTWTPLTDFMPGLSIGALEMDPTAPSNSVLVAGIGRSSSFGTIGGPLVGILRSTNGGSSWVNLGTAQLTNENISGVAPRGNTIVVAANGNSNFGGSGQGGIFRSTDGGASFVRLSGNGTSGLPNVGVFDLVGDPSNNARLYAGTQQGLFRSTDTGATWTNVTNGVAISAAATNNVELAVHNSAGNNVLYAGVINAGQLAGLWRSPDQGATWTQLDTPQTNEGGTLIGLQPSVKPGAQGAIHFSILADPTNANLVYLGGDRQPVGGSGNFPNSIGADDFSGRLFRCDASLGAGAQCTPLTHSGTSNDSSPHADSRDMVFDAGGDILEVDDGGVYRQTDPSTNSGVWQSLNGNLQIAEHHSCDYDSVGDIILCGNQDTGAPEQSAAGSVSWITLSAGDGGFVGVNDGGANSVRYSSSNRLSTNSFRRRTCTAANVCNNSAPGFNVVGQGQTIQAFEGTGLPLYTPLFVNEVDGTRLIVSSATRVYESTDQLDNLTIIGSTGTTRAVAYGGRSGGADDPGVLWYGTSTGLFLRGGGTGSATQLPAWPAANGAPVDITLNPEEWTNAFVTNGASVFETPDGGGTFADITGNLTSAAPAASIRSLEVLPIAGTAEFAVLAGTDSGVFMTQTQNLGVWSELGDNLPNTIAFGLTYDATDDVLLVGTMGRGAWLLNDASEVVPNADLKVTKSDAPDPVLAGQELFYTVTVTNDGPDEAIGAVVVDDLPDEVDYLSDDGGCTYSAIEHRLTCEIGDLANGASTSFVIKTLVHSDAIVAEDDGTLNIQNTVTAQSVSVDTDLSDNTETEITFVQDQADLAITKICKPDDLLPAGEIGFCTVYVDNYGPSSARDIVLTDTNLSDGAFTFGTITPSQGTCSAPVGGVVTCQLGDLAAMSTTVPGRASVIVEVTASEAVDINDVATVTAATPDPDPSNNQGQGSISVMAVTDLSITKTGPPTAVAGDPANLTYTLSIFNSGPSTATGVIVTDDVPAGVTVESVTASDGATCVAGVPGNALLPTTCSFGNMAPASSRTMTVIVHVLPDTLGQLNNDARVSSETFDDDTSNNLATTATDVVGSADLAITKSGTPDPVLAGEDLSYTITVTNNGPSTALDVVVSDTLPAGTSYVSGQDVNGGAACALVQPDGVVCGLGTLQPGETRSVVITVTVDPSVPDGTVLLNAAHVVSSTFDPIEADNSTSEPTTVDTQAELWLDKTGVYRSGNPSPALVYTLTVHNDAGCESDAQSTPTPTCGEGGPSDAQDITVTDQLPLDPKKVVVQYISPQCTYTKATHTVVCTSATVPAGASVSFVIETQVAGSVGQLSNTATLVATTADPELGNNTDEATVVIKGGTGKGRK